MQKTNIYSRFMVMLCVATLTAAPVLATCAPDTLKKASSATRGKACKKDKDIVKTALKKSLKRGISPHRLAQYKQKQATTSCCSNQKKQKNAAKIKMDLAKRKFNKQFRGNKVASDNTTKQRKKAIKHTVNKARPTQSRTQSTRSKAKGFFKSLFTGFLGM